MVDNYIMKNRIGRNVNDIILSFEIFEMAYQHHYVDEFISKNTTTQKFSKLIFVVTLLTDPISQFEEKGGFGKEPQGVQ